MGQKLFIEELHTARYFKHAADTQKVAMQAVVDAYGDTNLAPLEGNELQRLLTDTDNLIYDKLTGGKEAHLRFGKGDDRDHLPVNKAKAMEMLTQPKEVKPLVAVISEVSAQLKHGVYGGDNTRRLGGIHSNICKYFELKGQTVVFSAYLESEIEKAGKRYVSSKLGVAIVEFLEKIEAAFNESEDLSSPRYRTSVPRIIQDATRGWDEGKKKFNREERFLSLDAQWAQQEKS